MSGAQAQTEGNDDGPSNPLAMSDDDFLKLDAPAGGISKDDGDGDGSDTQPAAGGDGDETQAGGEGDTLAGGEDEGDTLAGAGEGSSTVEGAEDDTLKGGAEGEDTKPKPKVEKPPKGAEPKAKAPEKKEDPAPGSKAEEKPDTKIAATPEVMASFFQKVVQTPLKANGKTIDIRTPEEAIGLMQMGANYTLKLQQLAPYRKVVAMLEKNALLDEEKLGFLIDIANKNPDAIKKLVKESGIDPSEIDPDDKTVYVPGNHRVSDTEVRFRGVMDDLKSTPEGKETLKLIHTDWDDASKDMLWENPDVLGIIHQQRENGVYTRIATEIDRQKTLGLLPAEVPFLHAYKHVGDQLTAAAAAAAAKTTPAPGTTKAPVVVTTRTAAPKPQVKNGDKAAAAMGSRTTPKAASVKVNPLAMSDDDFMKSMENRL
jgi:hypothetical protein